MLRVAVLAGLLVATLSQMDVDCSQKSCPSMSSVEGAVTKAVADGQTDAQVVAETARSSRKPSAVQPYDASLFDHRATGGRQTWPRANCSMLNTAESLSLDHLINGNPNIRCTTNRILDAQGKFVFPLMSTIRQRMLSQSTVSHLQD